MDIKLNNHEKNYQAQVILDGTNYILSLNDYELAAHTRARLRQIYEQWQVNHIAKVLKEMMLDTEREKSLGGQVEDKGEKVSHYVGENGKDLIDKWHEEYPIEIFRVLMFEQMRKYNTRLGKKDDIKKEVGKIANYANRWLSKESA